MHNQIALITILTDDVPRLAAFYRDALGLTIQQREDDNYVEFAMIGARFSICARSVMANATEDVSYTLPMQGHNFELAFPCANPAEVDIAYAAVVAHGARGVKPPADMPWGQHTAFFADPDGNIHELFADLNATP